MSYSIVQDDVLEFFRGMPDCTYDACLTDPPYGLSFMGKEWDHGIPSTEVWAELLRVLMPGAPLLSFGGTRTHHRLMCAIEDSGFEIRDCLMWLYGCLSEDTEIVINGQWEPYHKATPGSLALCYDISSGAFSYQPVQELVTYDYDDTAYQICSDSTDQIVSRNHRCIVERDGAQVFQFAEEAAREREICIPVLEDVQSLLESLSLPDARAGTPQQDMLAGLCSAGDPGAASAPTPIAADGQEGHLRHMWNVGLEAPGVAQTDQRPNVLQALRRDSARRGTRQARPQGEGGVDRSVRTVLFAEDERAKQPGVEGWSDVLQDPRELQGREVCSLPKGIPEHGPQGRLCDGAPADCGTTPRSFFEADGSCSPQESRPRRQPAGPDALSEQPGPQTVRTSRYTRSDLAQIHPFHYRGVVWCIRVPAGAFVARRNGKAFVTGNSGFPKSLDISKAIDKAARGCPQGGSDPSSPGHGKYKGGCSDANPSGRGFGAGPGQFMREQAEMVNRVLVAEAQSWNGYGTALKPAWETIILAMKPCEGTFSENALKWGVAGLNVDGGRIESKPRKTGTQALGSNVTGTGNSLTGSSYDRQRAFDKQDLGRWPANLLLDEDLIPVLYLKYNIDSSIRSVIKEYFDDYSGLQGLRQVDGDVPEQKEAQEVLQPGMLRESFKPMQSGRGPSDVRQTSSSRFNRENAGRAIGREQEGTEVEQLERRQVSDSQGLLDALDFRTVTEGSGACNPNADEKSGLCSRTPASDGSQVGTTFDAPGDTTSQERVEGRQPFAKSGDERQRDPQDDPSNGGKRTSQTSPRKRTVEIGTLEVLELHVPPAWLKYFGHTGKFGRFGSAALLDEQSGNLHATGNRRPKSTKAQGNKIYGEGRGEKDEGYVFQNYEDAGGASRFFYVAKASRAERGEDNKHPTVKPIKLAEYLARLILPPKRSSSRCLVVPFCGSGSEVIGALRAGWDEVIGIDNDPQWCEIARKRIKAEK